MISAGTPVQSIPRTHSRLRSLLVMGGLWLSITAGFVAYRTGEFFVWNDSPSVMKGSNAHGLAGANGGSWTEVKEHSQWLRQRLLNEPLEFALRYVRAPFDRGENCGLGG